MSASVLAKRILSVNEILGLCLPVYFAGSCSDSCTKSLELQLGLVLGVFL